MSALRMRIEGEAAVKHQLAHLGGAARDLARTGARAGAEVLKEAVQANVAATFTRRTGRLRDGWEVALEGDAAVLTTSTPYARIHELGGTITPRRGRYLVWVDERSGERIFARRVQIPARPYFRPAWDDPGVQAQARLAMERAIAAAVEAARGA